MCVTEVPLLYEVGGETRFDKVVVVTASPEVRISRRIGPLREREERLIPEEEKIARADFVYVNDGSLADLDEFVSDVIATLSEMRIISASSCSWPSSRPGSSTWRTRSRPGTRGCATRSSTSTSSSGTPAVRPRPGAARRRHLPREQVRPGRALVVGRDRPHAAPAGHGARGSRLHTGGKQFVVDDLYDPEINVRYGSFYLRRLLGKYDDERLALAAYNAGQANVDEWIEDDEGIAFPETREYVEDVLELRDIYARAYADELGLD